MLTFETLRKQFEAFCNDNPVGEEPRGLYEPAEYIMSLNGKRLRPLLLLASYRLFREDYESAMFAALGVEVFHNFTLLHDDIMDSASLRRGHGTVHTIFGENAAILGGDAMMIRSFDFIMRSCPADLFGEVFQLMITAAINICEGQQLDMDFEHKVDVLVDEYLQMNQLKTAELIGTCLKMGAVIAGAPKDEANRLYRAGISFGRAFQVQDDLLDAYGKVGLTGKKRGGDIVNGKKTFLYTTALDQLFSIKKKTFIDLYHEKASNPEVKIQRVLRIFDDLSVKQNSIDYIESAYTEGIGQIQALEAPMKQKSLLLDFVQSLSKREL